MFGSIKKMFVILLTIIVSASNHTKCVSLNNQKGMTQTTFVNLQRLEYSQELCYYSFEDNLERCVRSFNTLDGLSRRVCVPNETEDLLYVFIMSRTRFRVNPHSIVA